MQSDRLTSIQRAALAVGALASLLVLSMAQCPLLSADHAIRAVLSVGAGGLALLCVSILVEDMLVRPLIARGLRALRRQTGLLSS